MTRLLTVFFIALGLSIAPAAQADLMGLFHQVTGIAAPSKTIVVLVDLSSSVHADDRALYRDSFKAIVNTLDVGDRLVLARIGDSPRSHFLLEKDDTIKRTGIHHQDQAILAAARSDLMQHFAQLNATNAKPAKATLILDAITASAEALTVSDNHSAYLVLLSDMTEESAALNFAKTKPSNKTVDRAKKLQLLPQLTGVNVLVCGAAGQFYNETHDFWQAYFAQTGATLSHYGRIALAGLF